MHACLHVYIKHTHTAASLEIGIKGNTHTHAYCIVLGEGL